MRIVTGGLWRPRWASFPLTPRRRLTLAVNASGSSTVRKDVPAWAIEYGNARHLHSTSRVHDQNVLDTYKNKAFPTVMKHDNTDYFWSLLTVDRERRVSEGGYLLLGQVVTLNGFLSRRKDLSKDTSFVFLSAKDLRCKIQVCASTDPSYGCAPDALQLLRKIPVDSAVRVTAVVGHKTASGKVEHRGADKIDHLELRLQDIHCWNQFPVGSEPSRLSNVGPEQRFLQIRASAGLRKTLRTRSVITEACRQSLLRKGFTEIDTPYLFRSTAEGAREFIVPTRSRGRAYALPQSPQQYKQLLVAAGMNKYFQIARCFRDEDLRSDRQPEFTQLDLEVAFADAEKIIRVINRLMSNIFDRLRSAGQLATTDIDFQNIPRMKYQDAMAKYGSDKPDLRIGMEIQQIAHLLPVDLISKISSLTDPEVDAMKIRVSDSPAKTGWFIREVLESPEGTPFRTNPIGQPGIFVYDTSKPLSGLQPLGFEAAERLEEDLQLEHGDLVVLQARPKEPFRGGSTVMGNLRLAIHQAAVAQDLISPPQGYEFVWITDFPLFTPGDSNPEDPGQGGHAGIRSTHHPFTAPATAEDVDLLLHDPLQAKGDHYDLVLNGVELGGGSRRIHTAEMQEFVFREILQMPDERVREFQHLLNALRAGCPPHAGIALGVDRLVATLLNKPSVRDVIAFPKTDKAEDPMVGSPSPMTTEQLNTYHLSVQKKHSGPQSS